MKGKCNFCGSTNFREVRGGELIEDGLDTRTYTKFHGVVCCDCGHIELFADEDLLGEVNHEARKEAEKKSLFAECEKIEKGIEKKVSTLNAEIEKAQKKEAEIEQKSKDVNITVREQQELLAELKKAKDETMMCRKRAHEFEHDVSNFRYAIEKFKNGKPLSSHVKNPLTGEELDYDVD